MRRLRNLLLVLTSLSLASCGGGGDSDCINHIDSNHDGKCDICEKEVSVNHVDSNKDGKCDVCGATIEHVHVDSNHDGKCDICAKDVPVTHTDLNHDGKCDICEKEILVKHVDADNNYKCDVCGAILSHVHLDANHDGKCDICEAEVAVTHIDADHNGICDICKNEVEIKHVDANHDCVCDVCEDKLEHVDKNSDSHCDNCGLYLGQEITVDSTLKTNEWGQGLKDFVGFVLGRENNNLVPQMPSEGGYECFIEEIPYEDGSGSQLACVINCYASDMENAIETYEAILFANGYYLGSSSNYGYKLMSPTSDIIIQYNNALMHKTEYLELIIYVAETRMANWPKEELFALTGAEIPVYECESYEFYYYLEEITYSPVAIIYDHNTGAEGLVNYHNQIMATGDYRLVSNTADGYGYLSNDGKIKLSIYPVADEYNRDSIYITVENNWPYFYISMMLGEDIPCYNMEIMEYMFQDIDGDDSAEYLTIFFDGVSEGDFISYCQQFIYAGWHINEVESNSTFKLFQKEIDETMMSVQVIYSESYGSICVALK